MNTPQTFGKYKILGELGRGGFAAVYRAKDTTLGREVALKLLDPGRIWEPGFVERFYQEARVSAQLKHPNIITVYEIGEIDGQLFIAMEFVSGGSLHEKLNRDGTLELAETVEILEPVAQALDYAHLRGVVHRDVKPANILMGVSDDSSRVVLTDFGLVKALSHSTQLTQSGAILGTVEYMAPEQADSNRRDEIGAATDTYSLGVVVYHMLTGRVPFTGSTIEVLMAHANEQPSSPHDIRSDLSVGVSDAILKALTKRPEDRFSTATEFVQALEDQVEPDHIDAKPPALIRPPKFLPTEFDDSKDAPTPTESKEEQAVEPESKGRSRWWWLVVPAILLALILAFVAFGTDTFHPRILALSYSPANPAPGDDIIILWRTKYAQHIDIWPMGLEYWARDGKGHIENGVSEDTDLIVIASNWLGEGKEALPIEVAEASAPPMNCDDAINTIADLARQDDCDAVIEKASEYINAGCSDISLFHERGNCYGDINQFELALQDFATAIERDPNEPWNYIYRSEIYDRMGDQELRLADLDKAVSVAPGDPQTYFHRADYYEDQGEWKSALDDLDKAIALGPTEPEYYDERGDIHLRRGDQDVAVADFEKVVELSAGLEYYAERRTELEVWLEANDAPNTDDQSGVTLVCSEAVDQIATLTDQGKCTDVIEQTTRYIEANCTEPALWKYRAICYHEMRQKEAALNDFSTAIELNPDDPWLYVYRADVYSNLGERELEITDRNTAVSLAPGEAPMYHNRALYFIRAGDWQAAIDDFTQAIDLDPGDADNFRLRAEQYIRLDDPESATADYQTFLDATEGMEEYSEQRAEANTWLREYAATPEPPATNTPQPIHTPFVQTCLLDVDQRLSDIYSVEGFGCSQDRALNTYAAWQTFEKGFMLWTATYDRVFVLYNNGNWLELPLRWDSLEPIPSRGTPPAGLQAPIRGFGWIWGTQDAIYHQLGWATDHEIGLCILFQSFEDGVIFKSTIDDCGQPNTASDPSFKQLFFGLFEKGRWQNF